MISWEVTKIINIANQLQRTGATSASTSEHIAAAFVLNDMNLLPKTHQNIVEAWERLDDWQAHVNEIQHHHADLIEVR